VAVDPDDEEKLKSLSAEMLQLHHKFNPISFGKIRALAHLGVVNPKLAKRPSPSLWQDDKAGLEVQTQEGTKEHVLFSLQAWQSGVC
jgi:hypothetical protein